MNASHALQESRRVRAPGPRGPAVRGAAPSMIAALDDRHRLGPPVDVIDFWRRSDPTDDLFVLSDLIKADLRWRFSRGESPTAADYLAACDELRRDKDRVVSLVYEEYCLLEEQSREGRHPAPTPDSFRDRYPTWWDSLRSQLAYHRVISQMIRPAAAAAPARWPSIGEVVEGCRLEEPLGKGGAASVFRAAEQALGMRPVVLKLTTDAGEEEDVLGKLRHRHIVGIHWARPRDPETGLRGICMPYQRGTTLDQVLDRLPRPGARRRALDLWNALKASIPDGERLPRKPNWPDFPARGSFAHAIAWLAWKLADALAHAHGREVIHRDLKPANILLTVDDGPQLLDFNLARNPSAPERAESAMRGGTLPYMAPEQLEAFLDERFWQFVGPRSDLYALSLVVRELLTGIPQENPGVRLPRARAVAAMLDHRKRPPAPIPPQAADVPHALAAILDQCGQPRPIDRYPSADALAEDLRRFLLRRPLQIAVNRSLRERAANRVFRARHVLAVAAAAAGLGGLVWLGIGTQATIDPPPPSPSPSSAILLARTIRPYLPLLRETNGKADPAAADRTIAALDEAGRHGPPPAYWTNARSILECQAGGSGPIDSDLTPEESSTSVDLDVASWFHDHAVKHLAGPRVSHEDVDEAIAAFQLSIRFGPREPRHWIGLASAYLSADRLEQGSRSASRALELVEGPGDPPNRASVSSLALKFRALLAYRWALHADPTQGETPVGLAESALQDVERADSLTRLATNLPAEASSALRRELALIRGRIQHLRAQQAQDQGDDAAALLRAIDAVSAYNQVERPPWDEMGRSRGDDESDPALVATSADHRLATAQLAELLEKCRGQADPPRLADGTPAIAAAERLLANPRP